MRFRVRAGEAVLRGLGSSWGVEWDGLERLDEARRASPRGNVIYAFWHGSLAILAYTHRRRDIQVLVSQHRDGELIARILERLGYGLVRGSSRRGGVEALFRMATLLDSGLDVAITVDGPIGPRYHAQSGAVLLARRTGRPIVPIIPTADRELRLRTWDALHVPLPGARVRIDHGEPLFVPESTGQAGIGAEQRRLETVLREATREAEARWGRHLEMEDVQDRRSYWERASEARRPGAGLRLLSRAYAAGARAERAARPRPRGVGSRPWVVGIGNLEAGGTGKTPCTELLAGALRADGLRVAVLTRGWGGALGARPALLTPENREQASDEARWLGRALGPRVPVVVSRDRAAGLAWLRQRGGLDVVLVDDAFQTPRLAVDRHLVLLDWERPLGNGWLLPAGRLREPSASLARADALLFTRARAAGAPPLHPAWERHARLGRCFTAVEVCEGLRTPPGVRVAPETLRGHGVALLCGIGRPQAFEAAARRLGQAYGFAVRRAVRVGDHAPLEAELRKLAGRLEALGCRHVLTTAKDVARLPPASEWNEPLLVLEQRLEIGELQRLLGALLPDQRSSSAKFAKLTESEA